MFITIMAASRIEDPLPSFSETSTYAGDPRNNKNIDSIKFDASLQPKDYHMLGTHSDSRILFTDVNILDSLSRAPYRAIC